MMDVKICKNCKHSRLDVKRDDYFCWIIFYTKLDLVTGISIEKLPDANIAKCTFQRSHGKFISGILDTCGKQGKYFEQKEEQDNKECHT